MKEKIMGILISILLITTALPAVGSLKLNNSEKDTFLDGEVDQKQDVRTNQKYLFYFTRYAQSFTPTLPILTKVSLLMYSGPESSTVTVGIRKYLEYSLDIVNISIPADEIKPHNSWVWVDFDFSNFTVKMGETYYIVVTSDDHDDVIVVYWGCNNYNPYPNGEAWEWNYIQETWEMLSNTDFCFITYGKKGRPKDDRNCKSVWNNILFQWLIENHPNKSPLLQYILGL